MNTKPPTTDVDLLFVQLEEWHRAWCVPPTEVAHPPAGTSTRTAASSENNSNHQGAEKDTNNRTETPAAPPPHDPLLAARIWIKQQSPVWLQDTKRLDGVLKHFLSMSPPSPPQATAVAEATALEEQYRQEQPKITSLRHFEWKVVLFLELRVRCGGESSSAQILLERFAKVQGKLLLLDQKNKSKKKKKKHGKRKRQASTATANNTRPAEEVYTEYLMEQLTRIAFLLPSNEPFGIYLWQKCLTKYMWKRIPTVVSRLLDYFEVDNPYLPKVEEVVVEDPRPRKKVKRSSKDKPAVPQQQPAPRRPLVTRRDKNHHQRINHFHSMLTDVTKLLDNEQHRSIPATATSSIKSGNTKKVTTNQKKKKPSETSSSSVTTRPNSTSTSMGSVITPHQRSAQSTSSADDNNRNIKQQVTSTSSNEDGSEAGAQTARLVTARKVTAASSSSTLSPVPAQSRLAVAETPLPNMNCTSRRAAETPATNQLLTAVGETPSSHYYRSDGSFADHTRNSIGGGVAETPFQERGLDDDDRFVFASASSGNESSSQQQQQQQRNEQDVVKPMKLFGALQPIKKISKALSVPKLGEDDKEEKGKFSSVLRPTNVAVAAARSFLRRKSM